MLSKPVELQLSVADCVETEEKLSDLVSAINRLVKVALALPTPLYRQLAHLVSCADCTHKLRKAGCNYQFVPCEHGLGVDLGNICLHQVG